MIEEVADRVVRRGPTSPRALPGVHRSSTTQKPFDSPSLFRRRHARRSRGMGPWVAQPLPSRPSISARGSSERRDFPSKEEPLPHGKALAEDVAFHNGLRWSGNLGASP